MNEIEWEVFLDRTNDSWGLQRRDKTSDLTNELVIEVLSACKEDNLAQLKTMLKDRDPDSSPSAKEMLFTASIAKSASVVQYLLDQFPSLESSLRLHEVGFDAGPEIYNMYLQRFPELFEHSFGHMGDQIGMAVLNNDLPMLSFLLNKGFNIMYAHLDYTPILTFAEENGEIDQEIIDLLKSYGAPTGEYLDCYNP
ncbi:MAG: hypothetical protein M4579_007336 [Chaenotheca gracillima]|nr:MAG: hypothetical protein M4579_007336 [Chaenotheca gracillima]